MIPIILCLVAFVLTQAVAYAEPAERRVKSNPNACPITTITVPEEVIADHDVEVLTAIASGMTSEMPHATWRVSPEGDRVRFLFPEYSNWVVLSRLGIALSHEGKKDALIVRFTWVPIGKVHGTHSGSFVVHADRRIQCFVLGSNAGIPGFEVKEFILELPPEVEIHKLLFSIAGYEGTSVSCPIPDLLHALKTAYHNAVSQPEDDGTSSIFIDLLRKAMLRYDCRRSGEIDPVPVWWLCNRSKTDSAHPCDQEDVDDWLKLLASLESRKAKELLGSKLFRNTLDGMYAELYSDLSRQVGRDLRKGKKF